MKNRWQNMRTIRLGAGLALFVSLSFLLIACMIVPITDTGAVAGWENRVVALETRVTTIETRLQITATPVITSPAPSPTQSDRGIAITVQNPDGRETLSLAPAQQILALRRFNQASYDALAAVLTGTLHLELALVHTTTFGNNSWQLYHAASFEELIGARQSREYAKQQTADTAEYTRYTFGAPYIISATAPITSLQALTLPTDFAGWINHLRPIMKVSTTNPFRPHRDHEPARLLFSRTVDSEREAVLVIFGVRPSGIPVDGPDDWEWVRNYCASCGSSCPYWCNWFR